MTDLIISEKPAAALKIATALADKTPKKISNKGVPYYELTHKGNEIIVGCAVGHLFTLGEKTKKNTYPSFDIEWQPNYLKSASAKFTKKYFDTLKSLSKKADEFTVACDYDIEGSTIGANVVFFISNQKDAKRMKFSTLTKNELITSYENASKHLDWPQIEAGYARHFLDWLYGINTSRALTNSIKNSGKGYKTMSSGRVQGPTLKIIVDREKEIKAFIPVPYWQLQLLSKHEDKKIEAWHEKDKFDKESEAKKIFEKVKDEKEALVKENKRQKFNQAPPSPFDLTSLQTEAYKTLGIQPKNTLEIAQKLYLAGLISYPRTSSQQLPESLDYKKILTDLSKQKNYSKLCNELLKSPLKPNNGKKSDPAHPCFTENTKIKFNDTDKTFKEIISRIKNWKFDKKFGSFYSYQNFNNIYSYNHNHNEIMKSKSYKIWKTPVKTDLINLHINKNKIETTKNHEFYALTKNGLNYTRSDNLIEGDYLFYKKDKENQKYKPKIKEKDILSSFSHKHKKEILSKKNKKIFKTKQEIEMFFNDLTKEKTKLLAQIVGFCNGDGHISFKKPSENREEFPQTVFVGNKEDMKDLKQDINELGFNSYLIKKYDNLYYLSTKGLFARILIASGCPIGDKVSQSFFVPKWILNSDKTVKSHFLKGLFGAELTKTRVHHYNKRDIRPFSFTQNKIKRLDRDFNEYLAQLKKILLDIGINSGKIKIKDKIIRKKDNEQTIEGSFDITNSRRNLIKFLSEIGYAYCHYKEKLGRKTLSYLIYKDIKINYKNNLKLIAQKLYKKGLNYKEISKKINVSPYTIKGWVYYNKGNKENHVSIKDIPNFIDFNLEIPKDLTPYKVTKIKNILFNGFVYDLEVKNTHNYFAEGFLTHNCVHPTGEIGSLDGKEFKLYDLIVRRTLATFSTPAIRETQTIKLDVKKEIFILKGTLTIEKNWHIFYEPYLKLKEEELPKLNEGDKVKIKKINLLQKETQPPKRFTPSSIIKKMETLGLGTKSTRSAIVDTLQNRFYIKGTSLEATNLGIKVIETLEKYCPEIIDVKLTEHFEKEMEEIQDGKRKKEQVLDEAKKELTKIFNDFKKKEKEIGLALSDANLKTRDEASIIGKCDKCGEDLRIMYSKMNKQYFIACSGYPKCRNTFSIPSGLPKPTGKVCKECGAPIVTIINKGRRPIEYCLSKECPEKKKWFEKNFNSK